MEMGFSKEIKDKVMVATARRCCVCKEFVGRNIEVHHIIQKSEGGQDTFENAIPLCFDCHAEAGHYNSKHPRGTKFSPDELRMHRDLWYSQVENGNYKLANDIEISQQFLLTDSFEIINEIIHGDFSNFPFNEVLLYENELFHYLKEIKVFKARLDDYHNHYHSLEDYRSKHTDAQLINDKYGFSQGIRIPSEAELKEKFFKSDYIVNYMLRHNIPPKNFSKVHFDKIGCPYDNYETYFFSEARFVFLAVFNTLEKAITIEEIQETFVEDGGFINLNNLNFPIRNKATNSLLFDSGKCLIIPYCIILSDFNSKEESGQQMIYRIIHEEQTQDVRPIKLINQENPVTIGVRNVIKEIKFDNDGFSSQYMIKSLNTKNLLKVTRFWEYGSCPHLFGRNRNNYKWEYIGELFSDSQGVIQEFVFQSSRYDFNQLKIIEIENEITEIDSIFLDGSKYAENIRLEKGDGRTIPLKRGSIVKITGKYILKEGVKYVDNLKKKHEKIEFYAIDHL